jgi:hypothetical protein
MNLDTIDVLRRRAERVQQRTRALEIRFDDDRVGLKAFGERREVLRRQRCRLVRKAVEIAQAREVERLTREAC